MALIAVDVVLLVNDGMNQRAIVANSRLTDSEIVLDGVKCLPHISLCMGVLDDEQVGAVETVLADIAGKVSLGVLRVTGIFSTTDAKGQTVCSYVVEKTAALQKLHEQVMIGVGTYLSQDAKPEMFAGEEQVSEGSLKWVREYPDESSFEKFQPHITIGYGTVEDGPFPIEFGASKLALCHLGDHCTCRKVLARIDL